MLEEVAPCACPKKVILGFGLVPAHSSLVSTFQHTDKNHRIRPTVQRLHQITL